MNLGSLKKVYCLGLGGVGVSAVAKYLLAHGVTVVGSDPNHNPLVDDAIKFGAIYFTTEDAAQLTADVQLVITTDDARPEHPVRLQAKKLGIPVENFSVTLGQIMATYQQRICIGGTNGKSTTTALTGLLLEAAGLHPTVFVGSRVSQFDGNLRLGAGNVLVAEADEYRDHFLNFQPTVATITNIELDHLDYFPSLDQVKHSFSMFESLVPADGTVVLNADDPSSMDINSNHTTLRFGMNERADVRAVHLRQIAGQQQFEIFLHGKRQGTYTLHLPGTFNVINAVASVASALAVGADPATFAKTIADFRGVWRRFENLNPGAPVTIVNDYAHHPTAVRGTLDGAKAFYPGRRIVAVFQPHHHNRLTKLFDDFAKSFDSADETIIVETYTVPGREPKSEDTKSSRDLALALQRQGRGAEYAESPAQAQSKLETLLKPGDVCIIMGAGDIWRIGEPLAKHYA